MIVSLAVRVMATQTSRESYGKGWKAAITPLCRIAIILKVDP